MNKNDKFGRVWKEAIVESGKIGKILSQRLPDESKNTCRKFAGLLTKDRTCKGKGVPLHAMEAHWERGGIAPTHT
jgi:hypothetical protein